MPRACRTFLLLVIAGLISVFSDGFHPARPDTGAPGRWWFDQPGDSLFGTWRSSRAMSQLVYIAPALGAIQVRAPGEMTAVGFGHAREFVGVVQWDGAEREATSATAHALLHLWRLGPTTLEARYAFDVTAPLGTAETWEWVSPKRMPPPPPRGAVPLEAPPVVRVPPRVIPPDDWYVEDLPEALTKVAPEYPEWARQQGLEGVVVVKALVGTAGLVLDAQIVKSIPGLDPYAAASVRQWTFQPAKSNGKPVAVWVAIPVKFSVK